MRRQYTRFYIKDGVICGSATQDTPYKPEHDPIRVGADYARLDVVMDLDDDQGHVDAGKLGDELMIDALGRVKVKADKPKKDRVFTLRRVLDTNGNEVPHR